MKKRNFEMLSNYLLAIGFAVFGGGILISIINQSIRAGMPVDLAMILIGIALIILGMIAAKIFGDAF